LFKSLLFICKNSDFYRSNVVPNNKQIRKLIVAQTKKPKANCHGLLGSKSIKNTLFEIFGGEEELPLLSKNDQF